MKKGCRGDTTMTPLDWIQKISFPEFQFKVLTMVNKLIAVNSSSYNYSRLLDVGCGTGDASFAYLEGHSSTELYGIDWRDSRSAAFAPKFTQFNVVDLEKENLPFNDEFFDVIVANQVFEHLKNILIHCLKYIEF
jgi:ubiquinone/menaquinone biosynthesis C-methylase UbiE